MPSRHVRSCLWDVGVHALQVWDDVRGKRGHLVQHSQPALPLLVVIKCTSPSAAFSISFFAQTRLRNERHYASYRITHCRALVK